MVNADSHYLQVFYCRPKNKIRGLFSVSNRPSRSFIVTTEQKSDTLPVSIRVNVLRRNASEEQLSLVQTVTLQESITGWSTFANGPNGSVFCAIYGSSLVHEICRAPGAAAYPFGAVAKPHRLSEAAIRYICGFHFVGESRIVASFADNSVRVFRATGDKLSELQLLRAPNWPPTTLVGLADGAICICSQFTNAVDSKQKWVVELFAADERRTLFSAATKAVHEPSRVVVPLECGRSPHHCG